MKEWISLRKYQSKMSTGKSHAVDEPAVCALVAKSLKCKLRLGADRMTSGKDEVLPGG